MMAGFYGSVDGGEDASKRTSDPFECLLALCRVIGFRYEVRKYESTGHWSAKLMHFEWPADFYGGKGTQTKRRSYSTCGHETKLDALSTALNMAIGALRHNCDVWRRLVAETNEYHDWFPKQNS